MDKYSAGAQKNLEFLKGKLQRMHCSRSIYMNIVQQHEMITYI